METTRCCFRIYSDTKYLRAKKRESYKKATQKIFPTPEKAVFLFFRCKHLKTLRKHETTWRDRIGFGCFVFFHAKTPCKKHTGTNGGGEFFRKGMRVHGKSLF